MAGIWKTRMRVPLLVPESNEAQIEYVVRSVREVTGAGAFVIGKSLKLLQATNPTQGAGRVPRPRTRLRKRKRAANHCECGCRSSLRTGLGPCAALHRDAGCFHTSAWARVLHQTYKHQPFYLHFPAEVDCGAGSLNGVRSPFYRLPRRLSSF